MRQRNTQPYPVVVPDIPADVAPNGDVDWPDLICGFEPDPAPVDAPPDPGPVRSSRKTKAGSDRAAGAEEATA